MIRNAPTALSETKSRPTAERPTERRGAERTQDTPANVPAQNRPNPPRPARSRTWIVLLVLAVGAGVGWYFRTDWVPKISVLFGSKAPAPKMERVVPVVTATAATRDMDIFLNGLGTVTALKTATIRSRVDGEVIAVPFEEGEIVEKGTLVAEIDSRPFVVMRDQAAGQLARDEATLKNAKIILDRLYELQKNKATSTQEVQTQESVVQQTEGIVKSDRAMVANAELQITYCKIISPFKGRIGLRLVDVGNIVRANDPNGMAVINQLEPIAVTFTISQDEIPRVQSQLQKGDTLRVEAYDRDFVRKLAEGTLLATDNQVDSTTGTLRLKAIFEKDAGSLFPNQFVNTRLLVDTKEKATVVPTAAVQRGPTSNFVYVVKADNTVELRDVVPGPTEGSETSIEKGLAPGEIVVTEGLDKLQPNAKVSTRDPNEKGKGSGDSKKGPPEKTPVGKSTEPAPAAK